MQQYDIDKLQGAFKGKKRYQGYTLSQLAEDAGFSLSAVARVLELGRGRPETIDRVARALGFKGRQDVTIGNGGNGKNK
jgi:DNA-binding phage protein